MKNQFWIRGFAVSLGLTGFAGLPTGQLHAQYNQGLAPQSYPIMIGDYPSLAQNTQPQGGHVHVPQGTYTAADQAPSMIPGQYQDSRGQGAPTPAQSQQLQPANITPLPPVQSSTSTYTQPTYQQPAPLNQNITPMYSVPSQCAPAPQPIPIQNSAPTPYADSSSMGTVYQNVTGSCSTCNQGAPYQGPTYQGSMSYGPSVVMPRVVGVNPWFVGAGALIFNRQDNEEVRLSSLAIPGVPVTAGDKQLSTIDARMRTSGGFQAFGGRYFGCGRYALMGTYWGLYPSSQSSTVYDPDANSGPGGGVNPGGGDYLRTDLPFTVQNPAGGNEHGVEMPGGGGPVLGPDGGRTFYDWYTNSVAQRVTRSQDYNNVEISLFSFGLAGAARNGIGVGGGGCGGGNGILSGWQNGQYGRSGYSQGACGSGSCGGCGSCNSCQAVAAPCTGPTGPCGPMTGAQCSRLRLSMLGGVRWFRYNDYLEYAASDTDTVFGPGSDDIYYRNTLRNDLLGFQLGGLANYCCGRRVNLYASSKAGIFGNRTTFDSYAGTTNTPGIISSYSAAYDNQDYVIHSTKTGLSLLGEVESGLAFRITQGITGTCGYRVVGISGVASAPGQIPSDFSDITSIRRIQNDGSVILHGLSFGGMYNW